MRTKMIAEARANRNGGIQVANEMADMGRGDRERYDQVSNVASVPHEEPLRTRRTYQELWRAQQRPDIKTKMEDRRAGALPADSDINPEKWRLT